MEWSRVKEVFLAAIEQTPAERASFLAEICAGDDELRREVESLLASDAHAGSFCESPAAAVLARGAPPVEPAPRLQPGARIGAYEITGFIGAGGMGDVYRARHTVLGREVAVKSVRADTSDESARQRLIREARHACILKHPGICTIYEVVATADGPLIVMELVDGRSLYELLREGPLGTATALTFGIQIAHALEHAHDNGVVHRDLKSSNVVIDADERAVVLDFGLARRVAGSGDADGADSTVTQHGTLAGTLSHMAPEVLLGHDADERSDVWALGILLYEMLAGELPFRGQTPYETTSSILNEPVPPLSARVPLALRLVVERCLLKQPAERYQHAADVATALDAIRSRRAWPLIGPLLVSVRRRTLATIAAGAALVVAGAFVIGAFVPNAHDTSTNIIIADFVNRTNDEQLAAAVTEALNIDLSQSDAVRAATGPQVGAVLKRMGRDTTRVLTEELAREIAVREGFNAVLRGEVAAVGSAYMISAQLITPDSGRVLFSIREDAAQTHEIIAAVDRLSERLRRSMGESLRSARAHQPLEAVTTSSLEALKLYSAGMRTIRYVDTGDGGSAGGLPGRFRPDETGVALFERAIALDSTFAAAYRALGVQLYWAGDQRVRVHQLLTRAYELRQRLTERERLLTEGTYFNFVAGEQDRAIASFQAMLDRDSTDVIAIQHLALLYFNRQDFDRAVEMYERDWALRGGTPAILYTSALLGAGRVERADSILAHFAALDSTTGMWLAELIRVRAGLGDFTAADTLLPRLEARAARGGRQARYEATTLAGRLKVWRGYYREGVALQFETPQLRPPLWTALRLARFEVYVLRDPARARRRLDAALAVTTLDTIVSDESPYVFLASVYTDAGDFERAMEFRKAAQRYGPLWTPPRGKDSPGPTIQMAFVRAAAGDIEQAREILKSIEREIGCSYGAHEHHLQRARVEELAGHPDSVIAALERLVAPPSCKLTLSRSDLWGPFTQAYGHERLAELYDARGDVQRAVFHYTKFVQLWPDPDPILRPRWQAAKRRIEQLTSQSDPAQGNPSRRASSPGSGLRS